MSVSMEVSMVRTQIQLSEEQARAIRSAAAAEGVSMAEIIRRAVDAFVTSPSEPDMAQKRKDALAVVGRFRSGAGDISDRHDAYLEEAFS
jgi:hypothetical protein